MRLCRVDKRGGKRGIVAAPQKSLPRRRHLCRVAALRQVGVQVDVAGARHVVGVPSCARADQRVADDGKRLAAQGAAQCRAEQVIHRSQPSFRIKFYISSSYYTYLYAAIQDFFGKE